MKLYVVDRDDSGYGTVDYGIVGIFSTKEKAVDFMRKIDDPKNKYFYEITETNLDSPGEEMSDLSVFMTE
jgi:hypothetical protein